MMSDLFFSRIRVAAVAARRPLAWRAIGEYDTAARSRIPIVMANVVKKSL